MTNLEQIIQLINDVKKGVLVNLTDGDDNTIIENKTMEILLLLGELRDILQAMKYCDEPDLSAYIQSLVADTTKELHERRDVDIKKKYPELENYLSDNNFIQTFNSNLSISVDTEDINQDGNKFNRVIRIRNRSNSNIFGVCFQ